MYIFTRLNVTEFNYIISRQINQSFPFYKTVSDHQIGFSFKGSGAAYIFNAFRPISASKIHLVMIVQFQIGKTNLNSVNFCFLFCWKWIFILFFCN